MSPAETKHRELTARRIQAYLRLFAADPCEIFSSNRFAADERFLIDVFVFPLDAGEPAVAAVTNGMSNQRIVDTDDPQRFARREMIQYFRACDEAHARRLRDMAWAPLFDNLFIDSHHTLHWPHAAIEGTPWKNAFFLEPIVRQHHDFRCAVEGDEVSLLWHIPISDAELEYKINHGSNAFIDLMAMNQLPWIFDENNRPPLLL
jgi:Suppressor of fused protein (SUFU)